MLALSRRAVRLAASRRLSRYLATSTPERPDRKHGNLPGSSRSAITSNLHFFNSIMGEDNLIPTYRVIDTDGKLIDGAQLPDLDESFCRKLYEIMSTLPIMDNVLYNVQRQGKISFYMTSHGEEASIVGSAAALAPDDEVLGQYREVGVLLWRGLSPEDFMNQCFGNENDVATKGRQMPVHIGSPKYHFHTISSPLATQIPQAAGIGFALKRDPRRRDKNCAVVYFGEGAASEGDFHAGMLLASTIPSPTLFFARNNGFAISTPASEQFHGDGVAARGPGYGVDTIRVDGNDVLAVLSATREARRRCIHGGRAVLIEAMTYRVGHHSTSDDSFAYRPRAEVEGWVRADNPLSRFRLFLEDRGWWSSEEEEQLKSRVKAELLAAFRRAESKKRPALEELFNDIYAGSEPWNIKEQREELAALLRKYGEAWEPWKKEMAKFKDSGKMLMGTDK